MGLFDDFRELLNWAFSGIEYSVGAGGRNSPDDVKKIQILLNAHSGYSGRKLETDSDCGRLTRNAILAFQRSQVAGINPDGRVDPGGRTFSALRSGSSTGGGGASHPEIPGPISRFETELKSIFDQKDWQDFVKALEKGRLPHVKRFLATISQTNEAKEFAKIFVSLKKWALKPDEIEDIFEKTSKLGSKNALKVFETVNNSASNIARVLHVASSARAKKEITLAMVDCLLHAKRKDYSSIFIRLVDLSIDQPVAILTLLEAFEALAIITLPEHRNKIRAFRKIASAINPIGFSKVAIKSLASFVDVGVDTALKGNGNNVYTIAGKLAQRLRMSGTKVIKSSGKTLVQVANELFSKRNQKAWEDFIDEIV